MADEYSPSALHTISAEEIHRRNLRAFAVGNLALYELIRGFLHLSRGDLYRELGSPSIPHYGAKYFKLAPSTSYQYVEVAEKLERLPQSTERFRMGSTSWSAIREIVLVASEETEEEWLDFAEDKTAGQIHDAVQEALKRKRQRPPKDGWGLPNSRIKLSTEYTREEYDLVRKAFEKVAGEMRESMGGRGRIEPKDVQLYMCRTMLETDPQGTPKGRVEREDSLHTVLYQVCEDCKKARVMTEEGPVEVTRERLERVEGEARKVRIAPEEELPGAGCGPAAARRAEGGAERPEIDRPNPPSLARKVRLREGLRCGNPHCRNGREIQANHLELRSEGGRTELADELGLCPRCHREYHDGLIQVERDAGGKIRVTTRGDEIREEFERAAVSVPRP